MKRFPLPHSTSRGFLTDAIMTILLLIGATCVGFGFQKHGFSEANIIIIYILAVLIAAVFTTQRFYSLILSIISVLTFNYFFTQPYFTLKAYDDDYPVTFLTMFLSAFITSTLAVRMKEQTKQSSEAAFRTQILLETNQLVQKGKGGAEIASVVANQLARFLKRDVIVYLSEGGTLGAPELFPAGSRGDGDDGAMGDAESRMVVSTGRSMYFSEEERMVANWVCKHNKQAGATTSRFEQARCRYLAIRINHKVYGVIGIAIPEEGLDTFENSITLSILGECALAMENEAVLREREQSALIAKNEQLRANLLRSISHDLRTPLTSISGNAGILLSSAEEMEEANRRKLYLDIYDDSLWLISLVENLLSVTRLEDGTMRLRKHAELIDEVIEEALKHVNRRCVEYHLKVCQTEEFMLVKIDAQLIMQVIVNIVDNAIKYTPPGSDIVITSYSRDEKVVVEIADNGDGIPNEAKPQIFEMFYTVNKGVADSRRSLGLGLALCKSIITAHGGEISVADNHPRGAVFRFTLPKEEVTLRE